MTDKPLFIIIQQRLLASHVPCNCLQLTWKWIGDCCLHLEMDWRLLPRTSGYCCPIETQAPVIWSRELTLIETQAPVISESRWIRHKHTSVEFKWYISIYFYCWIRHKHTRELPCLCVYFYCWIRPCLCGNRELPLYCVMLEKGK